MKRLLSRIVLAAAVGSAFACNKGEPNATQAPATAQPASSATAPASAAGVQSPDTEGAAEPNTESKTDPNDPGLSVDAKVVEEGKGLIYTLTASVHEPWVIKDTTPFAVAFVDVDGVTPAKKKLGKEDFVDKKASAKTVRTAVEATPGEHNLQANIDLFVCSAELCQRQMLRLDTHFTAK